jgi:hypothetical protein
MAKAIGKNARRLDPDLTQLDDDGVIPFRTIKRVVPATTYARSRNLLIITCMGKAT